MSLRCNRCNAVWPDDFEESWGLSRNAASSGYGSEPVCTAIVEDPRTKAGQVCRGRLRDSTAGITHNPGYRGGVNPNGG